MKQRQQQHPSPDIRKENEEEEEELYLPNHTIYMRSALKYLVQAYQNQIILLSAPANANNKNEDGDGDNNDAQQTTASDDIVFFQWSTEKEEDIIEESRTLARNVRSQRLSSLQKFHDDEEEERLQQRLRDGRGDGDDNGSTSCSNSGCSIDIIDNLSSMITPYEFQMKYQTCNVPCKIILLKNENGNIMLSETAEDEESWWFDDANHKLVTTTIHTETTITESTAVRTKKKKKKRTIINRQWFRDCLTGGGGPTHNNNILVPVRVPCSSSNSNSNSTTENNDSNNNNNNIDIDEDLRATECEVKEMTLDEWFRILDMNDNDRESTECTNSSSSDNNNATSLSLADYYLKDWHLISWCKKNNPSQLPLYKVPPHFGYDLLNGFLTKFTDNESDYKFCYWGPKGSTTALHSDVLNSFSWSYNVCGVKEWTFFPPPLPCRTTNNTTTEPSSSSPASVLPSSFVVRQESGECIFVPAGWKHTVTNLVETLSINHNWITTSNIDLVWDCLVSEMHQINEELRKWDDDDDDAAAAAAAASDMEAHESMLRGCAGLDVTAFYLMIVHGIMESLKTISIKPADWRKTTLFDLVRLADMIEILLNDAKLCLLERLTATLRDSNLAQEAVNLGLNLLEVLKEG